MATPSTASRLLSLPAELRLQVYEHIIQPDTPTKLVFASDPPNAAASSLLSLAPRTYGDACTTEWLIFTRKYPATTLLLSDEQPDGQKSEYRLRVHRSRNFNLDFMRANRQIYTEVLPLLWKSVQLDFTQAFSGLIPFANFLSPLARHELNHLILRAPLHLSSDRESWDETCTFINSQLNIQTMTVEYRYRSGTQWTSEMWRRKLAVDPRTRRPSDPAVRDALMFGSNTSSTWEDLLQFDVQDSSPRDIEFLESLPIESEDEMRHSLGIEVGRLEPLDSSLAALSWIRDLKSLHLKLVSGGLTNKVSKELDDYLKGKMLRQFSPLNLT